MNFIECTATTNDDDRRLDRIIRRISDADSLSGLYKAIRKGLVTVNGKKTESSARIHKGDVIRLPDFLLKADSTTLPLQEQSSFEPEIIFENENLLFINKPYDKAVHGSKNALDSEVRAYILKKQENNSLSFVPGPLHRLDRKTTGLLAFSKSLEGARWFSEVISTHSAKKEYCALLTGHLKKSAVLSDYILKNDLNGKFKTVSVLKEDSLKNIEKVDAKLAITEVSPIFYGEFLDLKLTFAKIIIKTGRTHQIRAQCAKLGYPLAGDTAYGASPLPKSANSNQDFFLHAKSLTLPKNSLGIPQTITAPLPLEFRNFLEKCGIEAL